MENRVPQKKAFRNREFIRLTRSRNAATQVFLSSKRPLTDAEVGETPPKGNSTFIMLEPAEGGSANAKFAELEVRIEKMEKAMEKMEKDLHEVKRRNLELYDSLFFCSREVVMASLLKAVSWRLNDHLKVAIMQRAKVAASEERGAGSKKARSKAFKKIFEAVEEINEATGLPFYIYAKLLKIYEKERELSTKSSMQEVLCEAERALIQEYGDAAPERLTDFLVRDAIKAHNKIVNLRNFGHHIFDDPSNTATVDKKAKAQEVLEDLKDTMEAGGLSGDFVVCQALLEAEVNWRMQV